MDPQTTAIGVGLIASLLFTEWFGLAAGGMIVPGYFALQFHRPWDIALTLAVAAATFLIVRGVSQFAIVYGRRRIVLMILTGFVLKCLVQSALAVGGAATGGAATADSFVCVVGCIIPGLIALWFDRQGVVQTAGTVVTTSAVVRLCLLALGLEVVL